MVSYEGLERKLNERGIRRSELTKLVGLSSRTIAKIGKGEALTGAVMNKLAAFFGCAPEELCRALPDNPILRTLREEKDARITGGLYHELQVRLTYNSNHIEGRRLSEEQTRFIFETDTLDAENGVRVDDVLETVHHFRAIDYVIDCAEEPLSEEIIKRLHLILKRDTRDDALDWFAVGDYKRRPNVVGGRETTKPKDVPKMMRELLARYHATPSATFEDIVGFHAAFEKIHPFQDGNGRVGRLIALKECLCFGIVPFLIEDSKKMFYYRGLAEWDREKGYLLDTCRDGQDTFRQLLETFEI